MITNNKRKTYGPRRKLYDCNTLDETKIEKKTRHLDWTITQDLDETVIKISNNIGIMEKTIKQKQKKENTNMMEQRTGRRKTKVKQRP